MSADTPERQEESIADIDEEITEPPNYRVLLHNWGLMCLFLYTIQALRLLPASENSFAHSAALPNYGFWSFFPAFT